MHDCTHHPKRLKRLCIFMAAVGVHWPLQSLADSESTSRQDSTQLQDVVVTATKVGEVSAQSTPASISVYDQDALREGQITNVEDLKRQTPGLNVTRNGQATRLYLRGIGTNLDFIGSDPSVTVHVDGVYQSRGYSALDDFLDVERVEVLRGPQGTLYGRNSTGGTINIITRLPDAKPAASVSAEKGNFNAYKVTAKASGGLGSDKVIGSVAVMQTEHDPYVRNVNPKGAEGLFDDNTHRVVGSLRTLFGGGNDLVLRSDYTDKNKSTGAYKTTGLGVTGAPAPLAAALSTPEDPFEMNTSLSNPFVDQTSAGHSAELNISLAPGWGLTSLTGYRNLDFDTREDTDGSNANVLVTELSEKQNQLSEELRLHYKQGDISWVSGIYVLQEKHDFLTDVHTIPTAKTTQFVASNDTRADALFTQGSWQLAPALKATAGVRYSREEKQFENNASLDANHVTTHLFTVDTDADWSNVSPKLTLDYTLGKTAMMYADASKGFKSGGFNVSNADAQFDPEKVTAYEVGAKLDWLNHSIRSNIAVFYDDYSDLQVSAFSQPGVLTITNAASATNKGVEIENLWLASENWAVELNYAFLDARYDKYMTAVSKDAPAIDVSGNYLNAAPRNKVTTALRYYLDSTLGLWSTRLEYAWQDKQYFTAFNEDTSSQGAYGLVNARVSLSAPNESWEAALFGQNLTNRDYSTSSREFPAAATGVTRDINPPRTVGASLTYNFK